MAKSVTGEGDPVGVQASEPIGETQRAPKRTVVRYRHDFPFQEREITLTDWKRLGIDHAPVRWGKANNWEVPVEDLNFLTTDQFADIIEADDDLEVVEV